MTGPSSTNPTPTDSATGQPEVAQDAAGEALLQAVAIERSVTRTSLRRLSEHEDRAGRPVLAELEVWLSAQVATGVLYEVRPPASLALGMGGELRFSLAPRLEQRIVRKVYRDKTLDAEVQRLGRVLGERSLAPLGHALCHGDLAAFDRQVARKSKLVPISASEWLRHSVCAAFDTDWLRECYEHETASVVQRVLSESLSEAADCTSLYQWARAAQLPGCAKVLAEHAILRGEHTEAADFSAELPEAERHWLSAATSFLGGDLAGAHAELTRATVGRTGAGFVMPIVAILMLEDQSPEGVARAKKLMGAAKRPEERGMSKALRTLLRYTERHDPSPKRIDVYQMPSDASAWEFLLSAFTVHLCLEGETLRASWATHLTRRACEWHSAGYTWLAKQGLVLAKELHAHHAQAELERLNQPFSWLSLAPRELVLWDRLSVKPEWQKALEALAEVSKAIEKSAEVAYRVAWAVDMVHLTLRKPLLQRYQADRGGWTSGRHATLEDLEQVAPRLPPEDRAVLGRWLSAPEAPERESDPQKHPGRDAAPDMGPVFEALIGHPRVVSGGGSGLPVDVVRGTCRVVTHDEVGGVRVAVEPQGAALGFNLVADHPQRLSVYHVGEALYRVIKVLPQGVRIPKAQEPALLEVLGKLAIGIEVQSPHLGAEQSVVADATPCLRIASQSGAFLVQIGVRPFGEHGRFFAAAGGPRAVNTVIEGRRARCERAFAAEETRVSALAAACPALVAHEDDEDPQEGWFLTEEGVLELLAQLRDTDLAHTLEWRGTPGLRLSGTITRKSLQGRLRCIKGWYVAEGSIRLDAQTEAALSEIAEAPILSRGRFVRIAPGAYAEVEASMLRTLNALRLAANGRSSTIRVHAGAVGVLEELAESGEGFSIDLATENWLERVRGLSTAQFDLPEGFRAELRPYQQEGYRWLRALCELGLGACLADDMGLGKTIQIIGLLCALVGKGPALVVAPTSVCTNWLLELARFAPGLLVHDYEGPERAKSLRANPHGVWICSYALLQQDAAILAEVEWGTVVLDEAQFIKNPTSLRARAAYALRAERRIAATGTPVENNLGDLWAIFRFLNPGLLGDWPRFRRQFVLPVERDGSLQASVELRALLGGYVLRRMKGEVLAELPALTEVVHDVVLAEQETSLYALLREQIREKLFSAQGRRGHKMEVLAEITRLRRFCCHPKLVFPDAEVESAKIDTLLELIEDLRANGHRALIFSQFVDFLAMIREPLDERGIAYEYLDGSTPRKLRQARVDAFQAGSASLFLISLKAGGFGLNLTGADYVIHTDPWWNPAVESQATDRAHRIGQERPVTVYRLVTKGTIEGQIVAMQRKKRELAQSVLDGSELAGKLNADDLLALLGGPDRAAL